MTYETYPVDLVGGETVKENDRLSVTVSFQVGNRVVINFFRDLFFSGETSRQRQLVEKNPCRVESAQ